jgi:hypothetical protein
VIPLFSRIYHSRPGKRLFQEKISNYKIMKNCVNRGLIPFWGHNSFLQRHSSWPPPWRMVPRLFGRCLCVVNPIPVLESLTQITSLVLLFLSTSLTFAVDAIPDSVSGEIQTLKTQVAALIQSNSELNQRVSRLEADNGTLSKSVADLVAAGATMFASGSGTGSSPTPPLPTEVEKYLATAAERESEGRVRLVSFSKVNGQDRHAFGIHHYSMEVVIEVEALQTCYFGPFAAVLGTWQGHFYTTVGEPNALDAFGPEYFGRKRVIKGQRLKFAAEIEFVSTEKGWKAPNGDILLGGAGQTPSAPAPATVSASPKPSRPAGPMVVEEVRLSNETFSALQIYIDGVAAPETLKAQRLARVKLEVGSTHTIKAVAPNGKSWERNVRVVAGMRSILLERADFH